MYDVLIKNSLIADGSGTRLFSSDIAVKDGIIARIAPAIEADAETVLDAEGLITAPGFIDAHCHDDFEVLFERSGASILEQGITTEIAGHCGESFAPFCGGNLAGFSTEQGLDTDNIHFKAFIEGGGDMAAFFSVLESMDLPVNLGLLVGHGNVRELVMGLEDRAPDPEEMEAMKKLLRKELDAGALGFSSGLFYPPGCYAAPEEIEELAAVAADHPGVIYTTHMRNESYEQIAAVREAIAVGEKTGIHVQISHHKIGGKGNEGMSRITLGMVNSARARGQWVTLDAYPYDGGATGLINMLPPQYHTAGKEALLEQLKDPDFRKQVADELKVVPTYFENLIGMAGLDRILVMDEKGEASSIEKIAEKRGADPWDTLFDIIVESNGEVMAINRSQSQGDLDTILRHPAVMVGTDYMRVEPRPGIHPRSRGTFPKFLSRWCRENSWLTIEEGIRKITGLAADTYGLPGKGYIREGMDADIVIFDYDRIEGPAEYGKGDLPNKGIRAVFVNGTLAVSDGVATGKNAGHVIRRKTGRTI